MNMSKTTYDRRKEQGICVLCGKEKPKEGYVCCEQCKEKQKIYQRETREYYRNLGICTRCGKNKLFGEEKECPECVAKMYELNLKYKENGKFDYREWRRKHMVSLKEKGLCVSCGRSKAKEGRASCEYCLIKNRERSREYRMKKNETGISRSERASYGLCYFCGKEIGGNGRICKNCSEKAIVKLPKKNQNEIWKNQNKILFKK